MSFLDQFKKNEETKQDKDNIDKNKEGVLPLEGHTLKEIMSDKEHSDLFGKLLEANGRLDLAEKIRSGSLGESDISLLEEQRKIFSEKITQAEKIEEFITEDSIESIARNNPSFREIVGLSGKEAAVEIIKKQLKRLSIIDEDRFKKMAKKIEGYISFKEKGKYKEVDDKIEKLLASKEISSKEYSDALEISDSKEREKALIQLAKKYGKRWFGIRKLDKDLLADLKGYGVSMEEQLKLLNVKEKSIGTMLFSSISENESVRKSLFAEVTGEKTTEVKSSGFTEAKKVANNENEVKKAWEEKKKATPGYKTLVPNAKEVLRDQFIADQKTSHAAASKEKGWWARMFTALFESMADNLKSKLEL